MKKLFNSIRQFFGYEKLMHPSNFATFRGYVAILPFFLLLPLAYLIRDFFRLTPDAPVFNLRRINLDITSVYLHNNGLFNAVFGLEIILLIIVLAMGIYFMLFVRSVDISDPFKKEASKKHISTVAYLGVFVFIIDFLERLLLQDHTVSALHLLNIEYLVGIHFLIFFALVFSKGVDLKNEINLVV